jgi:imidazole glycerol-phosphate synthase subunit HisF
MRRLIAKLDIKGPNLVKGIQFEGLRALGNPISFAEYYSNAGIHEIILYDTVASLYGRNSLLNLISDISKSIFVPLCVSGGIRTLEDIKSALDAGADKVCINSMAIRNPDFIKEAVKKYGSSTIVIGIEAKKSNDNNYYCLIDNGREITGIEVTDWASQIETLGAGEILITSIDNEGTGVGFDYELVEILLNHVNIPIVIHGGLGKLEHISTIVSKFPEISGVASASMLHYNFIEMFGYNGEKNSEGNYHFLHNMRRSGMDTNYEIISKAKSILNGLMP